MAAVVNKTSLGCSGAAAEGWLGMAAAAAAGQLCPGIPSMTPTQD